MTTVLQGDCREVLASLSAGHFDAVVTDPPYHLTAVSRGPHARTNNPDSPQGRHRIGDKGFMGKNWDGGDVAFRAETWAAVLRVMKPGAYLLAFGGTRTFHRIVCAIEDAGFEVRDQLAWIYGSGFPKGTDKAKIPEPWQGWNTALKPAFEPIVLARKPMVGTLAENLQAHGTGAMNIEACRIGTEVETWPASRSYAPGQMQPTHHGETQATGAAPAGRWPANVLHDGSDEVVALFPIEAGAAAPVHRRNADKFRGTYGAFKGDVDEAGSTFQGDSGSAARFFYCPKADREDRDQGCEAFEKKPLLWSSGEESPGTFQSENTDRSARNSHPTVKPTELMRWLCKLITPKGGAILDPFMGSGSTGKAAMLEGFEFTGIELEAEYAAIAQARIDYVDPGKLFA